MTGLCGQRIMSQGRAHAFSSSRNIYTILLAHVGEAVSFVVCATKELRQPPSHCFGDAFSFSCSSGDKKLPLSCQVLRGQDLGQSKRFCLFWVGSCPSNSWLLARAKCDRGEWPRECSFLRTVNMACPPRGLQQVLEWPFRRRQLSALDDAHLPGACSHERTTGLKILCPDQMKTVNYPICWDQEKPTGYVKTENWWWSSGFE